ncbi:MAG: hypothetical protein IPL49_17880 [Saprospirales bacterium]|nr:hypothetical protein [Saprospirales bacterium]
MYSYILEGFEKEWSPPSNINYARYNNLPSGHYTFRVRATNGNHNMEAEDLIIPVFVEQAYYKVPGFSWPVRWQYWVSGTLSPATGSIPFASGSTTWRSK